MRTFTLFMVSFLGCLTASQAVANSSILVSCYRGPWKDVVWDRANPQFIDSLVAAGYSYTTANAVGERICRDPDLVDRPEDLRREVQRILRVTPKDGSGYVYSY